MAMVKVFVYAAKADYDISSPDIRPSLLKGNSLMKK